jgi:transcriptional regulator GlxA family with amidase domain
MAQHTGGMTCRVVIVAYEGFQPLDIVGPHEVFCGANLALDAQLGRQSVSLASPPYDVIVGSIDGAPPRSDSGMSLATVKLPVPSSLNSNDLLLVPGGNGADEAMNDVGLMRWITAASETVGRVTSVCSGSLLLASAGLLDGRRATSHWTRLNQLATENPSVSVDRDALYVNDGNVWTSAGVTAGIDMSLAIVEADHGAQVAQSIARHLVMFLRRPGGQSQFAAPVWQASSDHQLVKQATDLINAELSNDLSVARVAALCSTSSRHLTRLFQQQLATTPARFIEARRMEMARSLIESEPSMSMSQLARRCGFGTTETLRRTFIRHVGVSPDDYRKRFTTLPLTLPPALPPAVPPALPPCAAQPQEFPCKLPVSCFPV